MNTLSKDNIEYVRSLGNMQTVARDARGRISELTKAYTELSIQQKRLTDEERNGEYGKALSSSLQQLKQRINTTKKELADVAAELGGATSGTDNFSGAIGQLTSQLGINGDMLSTLTSGTIGYTAAVGAVATAAITAAKAFADYNSELAKQDNITTVTTGLKGASADQMTDAARALASVYDVDFREVINAANTLMTQFGKSGDDAIQLIRDGMQGMIMGDGGKLLSMINQYAPAFRDAGVSASQLVAVIQNSEGGIFTDQNMSAIVMGIKNIRLMTKQTSDALAQLGIDGQEMSRKMNDGSLTVFDALKQVAGQLTNVESGSKSAGEVMQTVFGRSGAMAGTNLGKAIETLNTNLEETKMQTGEIGQATADLQLATERLNQAIRDCFEYDGWDTMTTAIKSELIGAIATLIETLSNCKRWLEDVEVAGVSLFTTLRTSALDSLGPLGKVLNALIDINNARAEGRAIEAGASTGAVLGNVLGGTTTAGNGPTPPPPPPSPADYTKNKGKTPAQRAQEMVDQALLDYSHAIDKARLEMESGLKGEADVKKSTLAAQERLYDAYGKAYATYADPKYKAAQDATATEIVKLGGEVKTATEQQKRVEQAARELEAAQKKLAAAQLELSTAQQSGTLKDIYAAEKKVTAAQTEVTRLETVKVNVEQGRVNLPEVPSDDKTIHVNVEEGTVNLPDIPKDDQTIRVNIEATTDNVSAAIARMKEDLGSMQVGSLAFNMEQTQLVDMTTLQTVLNEQMKAGLQIDPAVSQDLFAQILNGDNIDDSVWQGLVDTINAKLKELDIDPINVNFDTGKLKEANKDAQSTSQEFRSAASAISSLGSAMQQIEDPAAKVAGMIAQAIASIALTFATSLKGTVTPWDWIAASVAGAATMVSTIAAIKSATAGAYEHGGKVPGTSYHGDNLLAAVNSGEVILSMSQQDNLVANMAGAGVAQHIELEAVVRGEQLLLVQNNRGLRTGRGEIVQSNRIRN